MFGVNLKIGCPVCEKEYVKDFGITRRISYKGREMVVFNCYYCHNTIASESCQDTNPMYQNIKINNVRLHGIIGDIEDIIVKKVTASLSEDAAKKLVIDELKSLRKKDNTNKYLAADIDDNMPELVHIIEKALCSFIVAPGKKISAYKFDDIKADCESLGCICY